MQARRVLVALIAAIIISGAFTLWLGKTLTRKRGITGTLRYVAVTHAVNVGETLTLQDLTPIIWPALPIAGAYVRTEDIVGKATLYPLTPGMPILEKQVAVAAAGLSGRIPKGMRAISLKSNDVVGVAGYLLPGTRVDVLVTLHDPNFQDSVTFTVLQDVQVMTAGQKMQPDPDGKAARVDVVTLLVTPDDAEKVSLASTQGTVQFILRNSADHVHLASEKIHFTKLFTEQKTQPSVAKMPATHIPSTSRYTVQVRRGDKDSVETF